MQIVIPLSGAGSRFQRAGYADIKPLIEVDGMPMIEHVVRMFPGETDFLFLCARKHLRETSLRTVLERIAPTGKIVGVEQRKLGPVDAVLQAKEYIKEGEPVVVNYTDFSVYWDWVDFKRTMARANPAGCVTAYRGFHPHSLGPNLYAYLRSEQRGDGDHYLLEIQEKHCFTDDRMNEFASSGTYYFRSGKLLKETFEAAVARDLRTNGEFYASMPFNLLVEQDLPVYIYELEHFLQWGTPEDLEEYQGWSEYFARWADWRPSLPPADGANLIPMAGSGERFRRQGYTRPKPLVPVDGAPMIRRVLRSLPPAAEWVAVCRTEHLDDSGLIECLDEDRRNVTVLPIDRLTKGQACTCLLAQDYIDPEAPLLIAPCDAAFVYDEERYRELTTSGDADCLVWTFRDHPHANRNPRQYGWAMTDGEGWIQRISCKVPLGEGDVRRDPGIIGAFWFRKARFFFEAAEELIRRDEQVNGEFYVDTSIEMLLQVGRRARVFDVDAYICFGVPDDVCTYEYWAAYFRKVACDAYAALAA